MNPLRLINKQDETDGGRAVQDTNLKRTVLGLTLWAITSLALLLIFGLGAALGHTQGNPFREFLLILGSSALTATGSMAAGALVGFLFGIPRTVAEPGVALSAGNKTGSTASSSEPASNVKPECQTVNTNLEQISDWLSKILVGVGLTQLTQFGPRFWNLAVRLQVANNPPVTLLIIVDFVICGFFAGYLITRLFLAGAFDAARQFASEQAATAKTLESAGAHSLAAAHYEKALEALPAGASDRERRALAEGAIFNALYEDPDRAIQLAQQYLTAYPAAPSAKIWAYLAAAYGQKFKDASDHTSSAEALASLKAKALEAVQQALKLDQTVKPLLHLMWDPNDPIKSPEDDDLEVFFEDSDFQRLLG